MSLIKILVIVCILFSCFHFITKKKNKPKLTHNCGGCNGNEILYRCTKEQYEQEQKNCNKYKKDRHLIPEEFTY